MTRPEFIALIGQDIVVDVEVMIPRMSNPHKGKATHG